MLRVYRRGELIEVFEEKNLIVIGSQQAHAKLLGGDVANQSVTRVGFGTLYARKTRSLPLNKEDDITLAGTWTVSF